MKHIQRQEEVRKDTVKHTEMGRDRLRHIERQEETI